VKGTVVSWKFRVCTVCNTITHAVLSSKHIATPHRTQNLPYIKKCPITDGDYNRKKNPEDGVEP